MSQFIENIKASEEAKEVGVSQHNDIRLHNARIARAKMPVLWELAIQKVRDYCEELKPSAQKNPKFKCHVSYSPNGFILENDGPLPRRSIQANLNIDGLCIQVYSGTKSSFQDSALLKPNGFISISVDDSEEISFNFNGETWHTTDLMAQYFVNFACEIK